MLYSSQVIKGLEKVAPNYMTEKWREDEEYLSYVEDLLATEEVQKLAEYTQHMHSTRLEHSISVSYHSYKLAKRWNGNARATARAGLLHDLFYYDWRQQSLTKALMPMFIHELQPKMLKKLQSCLI